MRCNSSKNLTLNLKIYSFTTPYALWMLLVWMWISSKLISYTWFWNHGSLVHLPWSLKTLIIPALYIATRIFIYVIFLRVCLVALPLALESISAVQLALAYFSFFMESQNRLQLQAKPFVFHIKPFQVLFQASQSNTTFVILLLDD